jgi:hypothetical protein
MMKPEPNQTSNGDQYYKQGSGWHSDDGTSHGPRQRPSLIAGNRLAGSARRLRWVHSYTNFTEFASYSPGGFRSASWFYGFTVYDAPMVSVAPRLIPVTVRLHRSV